MVPVLSLLCPTRGRYDRLRDLVFNLVSTCANRALWDVHFIYDFDDLETERVLLYIRGEFGSGIRVIGREHGENLSEDYYNWAWSMGLLRGQYVWIIGDDIRMQTHGWDEMAAGVLEGYVQRHPDGIVYAFAQDLHEDMKPDIGYPWGWFPILSQETISTLGYIMPKEYPTWGADILLAGIFNHPSVGRSLHIPSIVIDHISYHSYGNMERDDTGFSMMWRHVHAASGIAEYRDHKLDRDIQRVSQAIRRVR